MTKVDLLCNGQPRIIISTILVVLAHKFLGHRSIGSGVEDFLNCFTIFGRGGHVGNVNRTI